MRNALTADLLVIPTCQRSDLDLVRVGDVIEDEKDRLLEKARSLSGRSATSNSFKLFVSMLRDLSFA